ncbi:Outer membrane protein transport protein [Sulfidibacter corallicola]|uniref:Outer membrane protein transport protein n=1 Tax=Sulfidibacter corallicola TaxID=2818388 RepID=A0A8A4TG46_SULCO|nr:outer membrane protein transport protein [Sulfidibacter corallicola]QTD47688.1 outer membrane protein transport protein [Sulfidibacter corallicola]
MKRLVLPMFLMLAGISAFAQHNNRSARDLQFRFGNPGGRSLGFGGAFLALADDATAPVANPAGMTRTTKRSLAYELNYERRDNEIPFQSGSILQTNLFEFDYNFTAADAPESQFQVPYLAVVLPHGNLRYGFFVHQQAKLERSYTSEPITVCHLGSNFYPNCELDERPASFNPSTDVLDLDIVNAGASLAYGFGDTFSIGASLFFSRMDYQADSVILAEQVLDTVRIEKLARGEDEDFGGMVGALWRATNELSVGVTYKFQPEFVYTATLNSERPLPGTPDNFVQEGTFKIPDSLGIGVSIAPLENLTINVDAVRVYYSEVTDELIDFTGVEVNDRVVTQAMSDITELHVGMEWVFLNLAYPLSLRLGYWLDPYHAAVNSIEDSQILGGFDPQQPELRDIFFLHLFEEDENHYSLGLGWSFGENFQFDAAVEVADQSTNATVSGIYRF